MRISIDIPDEVVTKFREVVGNDREAERQITKAVTDTMTSPMAGVVKDNVWRTLTLPNVPYTFYTVGDHICVSWADICKGMGIMSPYTEGKILNKTDHNVRGLKAAKVVCIDEMELEIFAGSRRKRREMVDVFMAHMREALAWWYSQP